MFDKTWFRYLIYGISMICLSALVFGGFIYTFIMNPSSWIYLSLLAVGGASTLVTGILMLFDSVEEKLRHEFLNKGKKKKKTLSEQQNDKRKIDSLVRECERLKPDSVQKG